ncbi:ADP-forming succinate--CoA ligase subunit beta [Isachenkonia alkalipeptolytica]|uniref:Succinate--CoA ligase [ADP-forming] subunit beta n=1 Tax=Isachenkonia alkalipeptolytica TaxID=2565777 RepID=A0AA43XKM0_9CLOT|nr:ADP-forming succinate--CoA ligase subunit beta [Isachenkonia alkalipeptolytica]NBG88014.1 ADP-forming succinate--CoA ligase subunit beta [Isachenkonia alkalipeptolytica]
MNIHEYQGKELFRTYEIPVPRGHVAFSIEEAVSAAKELDSPVTVVKAQIHAGGRGKAGGVKIAKNTKEVRTFAKELLGKTLVTHQTGEEGQVIRRLLIEEGVDIQKEYYVGLVLNRDTGRVSLMASKEGGVDIEEVSENTPEKILYEEIDPLVGLTAFQGRRMAFGLNLPKKAVKEAVNLFQKLYKLYLETDASIIEINPLIITSEETLIALDGKLNFDDNALYRQERIRSYQDESEEDEKELEAGKYDLSYIALDGNIGCMVNGAGLAMATMDIIKHYGGSPANFLDVGGSATTENVSNAFKILLSDENVQGVFVNIFGGIMKCDVIATGIVEALKTVEMNVPLVVRLEGTNVDKGRKILENSTVKVISAYSMDDGAQKIVKATEEFHSEK